MLFSGAEPFEIFFLKCHGWNISVKFPGNWSSILRDVIKEIAGDERRTTDAENMVIAVVHIEHVVLRWAESSSVEG